MNPVIGILFCGFEHNRQFVTHSYIEAISDVGSIPVIIPYSGDTLCSREYFSKYFRICDGFLFCGGNDLSPLLFGEELMTARGSTDWKSDYFHIQFMRYVLSYKFPLLAICRGMQVLNVALGGTIYQDISLRPESSLNHMQLSLERSDCCHKIFTSNGSMLGKICGSSTIVNSFHHQCIKKLGETLKTTAIASDGIIEAIESEVFPFALGVQWHPECMTSYDRSMKNLFLLFTEIAKKTKNITLL